MRHIGPTDVFAAVRMINKLKMEDVVKSATVGKGEDDNRNIRQIGFDIMWAIASDISEDTSKQEAVYVFLSGPLEMSVKDIKKMPLIELAKDLRECADIKEWMSFFGIAADIAAKK